MCPQHEIFWGAFLTDYRQYPENGFRSKQPVLVFLVVAVVATVVDQVTKIWALRSLTTTSDPVPSNGFITFELIHNSGAAFSLGAGNTWIFSVLAVVVVAALTWWVVSGRAQSTFLTAIIGLITGGAVGNLIDRLIQPPGFGQGHVVDFINYNDWFIGNVADIWIVGGAIAMVGYILFVDENPTKKAFTATPTNSQKVNHD